MSYKSRIPAILERAETLAPLIVQKTAMDIEAGAKERTPPKIRTGTLQGSWEAIEIDGLEWQVGSTVHYAPYVEFGTHHPPRAIATSEGMDVTKEYSIPAHPMLIPAAEEQRAPFERDMKRLYS